MVDAVLGSGKDSQTAAPEISPITEAWSISLKDVYSNEGLRLDAGHYDRLTAEAVRELKKSKYPLKRLSELAAVNLPGQFSRIWAKDKDYGLPYINATDLMSLISLGTLGDKIRYLSRETDVDIDALIIREGWILLTCSGTIGRVFYVSKRLDGWAATHDLIRIIPKVGIPIGFLLIYLSSPLAQKQILGHTHGGQIDHVTHHQIGNILIPVLPKDKMIDIHKRTMRAINMREKSINDLAEISENIQIVIKK